MTEWTVIDPGKGAPQSADAGGGYTVIAPGDTRPLSFMDTMADQARQWGSHIVREVPRQAGLTLRHAAEGVAGIADPINLALQALGFHIPTAQSVAARRLTQAGVPEPATALERGVGDVSRAITQTGLTAGAAGAARAGAGLLPAPGATERVLDILRSQPATQAAAATGAGAGGALVRENELGGPWAQLIAALAGGGVGAAATAIPKTLAGIWSGAKAAVQPMSTEGQNAVVGATLNRLARDPGSAIANMESAPSFVPGSFPTTAEAALDPGLAGVQRVVADMPIHGPNLAARATEQNAARLAALRNVSGTPEELARATATLDANAARNYTAARSDVPKRTPELVSEIADLRRRPAFQEAVKRAIVSLKNEGLDIATEGKPAAAKYVEVDPAHDDLITAVRKLGGINPADEAVGSLAKANPFPPDPRFGPVWTAQNKMGSQASLRGHSLDRMAQYLSQHGYPVGSPDDLMEAIANAGMGTPTRAHGFDVGAAMAAEDPLASAIQGLTEKLGAKSAPAAPVDFIGSGVKLAHQTKLELDDMIEGAMRGGDKNNARVLIGVRDKLRGVIEHPDFSPQYRNARETYIEQVAPVNRMEALQKVEKTSQMGPLDLTGEPILSQARMKTNLPAAMEGLNLTPEQTAALEGVLADLNRSASTARAGANTTGSNTFKNLATSNALAQGFGRSAAGDPIAGILAYPLTKLYQWGGVNESLEAIIARAMQDPAFAAQLMKAAPRTKAGMTLGEVFAANARPAIAGASIGAATNQETSGAP